MILKLYAIFTSLLIIFLCLRPNIVHRANASVKRGYDRIIQKKITKEIHLSNQQCSVTSYPIIRDEIDSEIKFRLDEIKNYISITPEEEQKLIKFYTDEQLLKYSNIDLEIYNQKLEQFSSLEPILGKERADELDQIRQQKFQESSVYIQQKMANYYSEVLSLDSEKQELLFTLLSSDDQYRESDISFMTKKINLNPSQRSQLVSIYDQYLNDYDFITAKAKENGLNTEDPNFDLNKYRDFLFKEKIKEFIEPIQYRALEQYFSEMK